jgi:hypothetical protein
MAMVMYTIFNNIFLYIAYTSLPVSLAGYLKNILKTIKLKIALSFIAKSGGVGIGGS